MDTFGSKDSAAVLSFPCFFPLQYPRNLFNFDQISLLYSFRDLVPFLKSEGPTLIEPFFKEKIGEEAKELIMLIWPK